MGIELNSQQLQASYMAQRWWNSNTSQVFEISGAAGTGKTTLVRYIMDALEIDMDEVLFLAFMGKAATVMAKNGLPAQTIHSAIYNVEKVPVMGEDGKYERYSNGKIKKKLKFVLKDRIKKGIRLIVVDEGSTVNEKLAEDLLSFGIPVIVLGDLNQLPPVMGNPYFLQDPDVILTQIMRQNENNPIIYLSQKVLNDEPLNVNVYGTSAVISRKSLEDHNFVNADIVLTGTNKLRHFVNALFRGRYFPDLSETFPSIGEKVICVRNNWECNVDGIYLTNGMTGFISYISKEDYRKKTINIDFRPDFMKKSFRDIPILYDHLFRLDADKPMDPTAAFIGNPFEFAYAVTVHKSQGSQWNKVLFLTERMGLPEDVYKKFLYTGITRAVESVTIAI